jgi:hypothetical protein
MFRCYYRQREVLNVSKERLSRPRHSTMVRITKESCCASMSVKLTAAIYQGTEVNPAVNIAIDSKIFRT